MKRINPNFTQALNEYGSGRVTGRELAKKYCVSQPTISYWARKAGVKLRDPGRPKFTEPTPEHLRVLELKNRFTYEEVGRRCGFSRQRVHQICKRWKNWSSNHNHEVRDQSHPNGSRKENRNDVISFRLTTAEVAEVERRSIRPNAIIKRGRPAASSVFTPPNEGAMPMSDLPGSYPIYK